MAFSNTLGVDVCLTLKGVIGNNHRGNSMGVGR